MANPAHYADVFTFVVLIVLNIGLGLYFAFYKSPRMNTTTEIFLGSRSLRTTPLALSMMASAISSIGIVGFTAHYYIYGFHILWTGMPYLLAMPLFAETILPVLYRLRVTSVFEVGEISLLVENCYI